MLTAQEKIEETILKLSEHELLVYRLFDKLSEESWPTPNEIADKCGLSPTTVTDIVRVLHNVGLIQCYARDRTSNCREEEKRYRAARAELKIQYNKRYKIEITTEVKYKRPDLAVTAPDIAAAREEGMALVDRGAGHEARCHAVTHVQARPFGSKLVASAERKLTDNDFITDEDLRLLTSLAYQAVSELPEDAPVKRLVARLFAAAYR